MTVQITRAHAKALLAMFKGEHAEEILELDHGNRGELLAEWLNHPETQVEVLTRNAGVVVVAPLQAGDDPEKRPDFYTWTWDVEIGGGRWEARYGWKKPEGKVHNLKPLFTHGVAVPQTPKENGRG